MLILCFLCVFSVFTIRSSSFSKTFSAVVNESISWSVPNINLCNHVLRLFPLLLLFRLENAFKKMFSFGWHFIWRYMLTFKFIENLRISDAIFFGFHYNYNSDYRYAMIITFNWKSNRILSELVCSRLRKILPFIYFRKNTLISNGYPTKRFIRILKKRSIFIKQLLYDNSFFNNKK